ncbi:unnamed protein product, partial [Ixodes pacificus]
PWGARPSYVRGACVDRERCLKKHAARGTIGTEEVTQQFRLYGVFPKHATTAKRLPDPRHRISAVDGKPSPAAASGGQKLTLLCNTSTVVGSTCYSSRRDTKSSERYWGVFVW